MKIKTSPKEVHVCAICKHDEFEVFGKKGHRIQIKFAGQEPLMGPIAFCKRCHPDIDMIKVDDLLASGTSFY